MILAEIESKDYDSVDLDKLKIKFVLLKSALKEAIQKSIEKT